ncbi:MAG: sulfotransferase [Planctomycetales bacterium]|nr:sulfotransferase [Planctomycetales bacterium]
MPSSSIANSPAQLPMRSTGQERLALRSAATQFVKELVWSCVQFRPTKKPILIFGSRRSGSTLLMQMIAANPGVMFSDQPFGLYTMSTATINRLPLFAYSQIACPDDEEAAIIRRYLMQLLSGEIRVNTPWRFWSRDFHFFNDRICLKITDAKAIIDWIDQQCDAHIVVLTRHPIAQALSVKKNGWLSTGKGLLRNRQFVEQYLGDELESECWKVYRTGSEMEIRVADWALENLVPISLLPERSKWTFIGYEDMITSAQAVVQRLASDLGLDDPDAMSKQLLQPSRSTRKASSQDRQQMIRQNDRQLLVDSWQKAVESREVSTCFDLLNRFGISLYAPDSSMPNHAFLGRRGFA